MCRGTCTCDSACVDVLGQLVRFGFLLTVWVLGIELRWSGLVALIHLADVFSLVCTYLGLLILWVD